MPEPMPVRDVLAEWLDAWTAEIDSHPSGPVAEAVWEQARNTILRAEAA